MYDGVRNDWKYLTNILGVCNVSYCNLTGNLFTVYWPKDKISSSSSSSSALQVMPFGLIHFSCLVCIFVVVLCVLLSSYVYLLYCVCVCIVVLTLDAGMLASSQYSEGPATGHLDTDSSWLPCVYKQMLRWFPIFQVATTCFSCSPRDLNLSVTNFIFCIHIK